MKLTKISLIAAMVIGGLVAGSTIASAQDAKEGKGKGKGKGRMTVEQRMERLTTELKLTDEQKPKVQAVLEETDKKMQEVPREERRDKMPAIMEDQNKKLKEILTPEQMEKYKKMQEERKKGGGGGTDGEKKKKTE